MKSWSWIPLSVAALGVTFALAAGCSSSNNATLPPDNTVDSSTSTCTAGQQLCAGACSDPQKDRDNCGMCGNACRAGEVCSQGKCALSCGGGTTQCGTVCTNPQNDGANCGMCGMACKSGEVCSMGKCASSCGGGTTQCGMSCVDTKVDPANCGMCGKTCDKGLECVSGSCELVCQAGLTKCAPGMTIPDAGADGATDASVMDASVMDASVMDASVADAGTGVTACVDLMSDPNNCNGCGISCGSTGVCLKGTCVQLVCPDNGVLCGSACQDVRSDNANCGACGNTCAMGQCANGHCCSGVTTVYFKDDFSNSASGWTVDTEWQIGHAKASMCVTPVGLNEDPATDHTGLFDQGVGGVVIGGCENPVVHPFRYMTSPAFDTSAATTVTFSFWRFLNADYDPYMHSTVEVFDGTTWQQVFNTINSGTMITNDAAWTHFSYDVSMYKNASMQVRFGFDVGSVGVYSASSWNVDDVVVADTDCP